LQASVFVQAFASSQEVPVRGLQVPSAALPVAMLHAWQSFATPPPQAVLQQTPSTQNPVPHWFAPWQAAPCESLAMHFWDALQKLPVAQSESAAQAVGQVGAVALHR
jgi:hypothetical protein